MRKRASAPLKVEADPRGAGDRRVRELVSTPPVWVREDTALASVWELFIRSGLRFVPIVEGRGRPVGTVFRSDLAAAMLDQEPTVPAYEGLRGGGGAGAISTGAWPRLPVARDVMRPVVGIVLAAATLLEAVTILEATHAPELAVVDQDGALVGTVSVDQLATFVPDVARLAPGLHPICLPSDT